MYSALPGKVGSLEAAECKVADAIDVAISKLDVLVAQVPFPANIIVALEMDSVKIVLREFQAKLRG